MPRRQADELRRIATPSDRRGALTLWNTLVETDARRIRFQPLMLKDLHQHQTMPIMLNGVGFAPQLALSQRDIPGQDVHGRAGIATVLLIHAEIAPDDVVGAFLGC
jgi:hypothetical protein